MIDDVFPISPVPGDDDLMPGRLPFTAFGQFGDGAVDFGVFAQGTYWVDAHGEPFLIAEMDKNHLLRVLNLLRVNAAFFHEHAQEAAMYDLQTAALLHGHEQAREIEQHLGATVLDVSTDDWLRSTPLAVALFARVKASRSGN